MVNLNTKLSLVYVIYRVKKIQQQQQQTDR